MGARVRAPESAHRDWPSVGPRFDHKALKRSRCGRLRKCRSRGRDPFPSKLGARLRAPESAHRDWPSVGSRFDHKALKRLRCGRLRKCRSRGRDPFPSKLGARLRAPESAHRFGVLQDPNLFGEALVCGLSLASLFYPSNYPVLFPEPGTKTVEIACRSGPALLVFGIIVPNWEPRQGAL